MEHFVTQYLTKKQAAEFLTNELGLPTSDKTLSKLITCGGSPVYQKFGARVLYTRENLIEWANTKLSKPRYNSSCEVQDDK